MTQLETPIRARNQRLVRRGLTLIEAIVAIVVISIAVPPLIISMSDASVRRTSQTMRARARWLAVERLESIIADRHSATRGYAHLVAGNYPAETPVAGFAGFSRSVAFNTTGANFAAGTGYRTCSVTVTWMDARSGSSSLTLSTVLTDYTP